MTPSPLLTAAQEVVIGAGIGIAVASGAQYVLVWRNLRWTWALLPAAIGMRPCRRVPAAGASR